MRVLILGLSSIVQRRVLPAMQAHPAVDRIDVATRQASGGALRAPWSHGDVFDDYRVGLDRSRADLVYVSLPNSAHEAWAGEAIDRGAHVVVDKPAFLGADRAGRMVELAEQRGVCLAEATVFGDHPQIELARRLVCEAGEPQPRRITATFTFPPMAPDNFRYRKDLGGGALWDLGPYAISVGRLFYGEPATTVDCRVLTRGGAGRVETAFAMLSTFTGGRSVVGTFGFDSVYRNRLDILAADVGIEIDRVFTTPPDAPGQIRVTRPSGSEPVVGPCGDAFALFLGRVFDGIDRRDWRSFHSDLIGDARALERLRRAAGESTHAD